MRNTARGGAPLRRRGWRMSRRSVRKHLLLHLHHRLQSFRLLSLHHLLQQLRAQVRATRNMITFRAIQRAQCLPPVAWHSFVSRRRDCTRITSGSDSDGSIRP
jgi:hypothetical protein